MAKITVKAKIDAGVHLKYGPIIKGQEYEIEENDFGNQLFERPQGFESPLEKAEKARAQELVGNQGLELQQDVGAVREPPSPQGGKEKSKGGET